MICCGTSCKTNNIPTFTKTDEKFLNDYNEGRIQWSDENKNQILYYQKLGKEHEHVGRILVDEKYVLKVTDNLYILDKKNIGMRILNDTVYYFNKNKGTNSGWRLKHPGFISDTKQPENFNMDKLSHLYNSVYTYENDSLIFIMTNNEVKNIWKLPDGYIYISEPGLGVFNREHITDLLMRIEEKK